MNSEPRKRRRYSAEEKASALARLAENSNLRAPITVTARELQICENTLFAWSTGRGVAQHVLELVRQKNQTAADLYEEISVLANVRLVERLSDADAAAAIPARDLVVISGTSTDKARLLREQPTAITESRNDTALRARALELLEQFTLALGGDEAQARVLLAQEAPTLSQYVQ